MGTGKLRLETKQNIFWAMVRKVVKITVNHHNSGDHFSKTATATKQKQHQPEAILFYKE